MIKAFMEVERYHSPRSGGLRSRKIYPMKQVQQAAEYRKRIERWLKKLEQAGDDLAFAAVCGRMATLYLRSWSSCSWEVWADGKGPADGTDLR
jgi:hypothetical protein